MGYHSVFAADLFKGQTFIVTGGGSGFGEQKVIHYDEIDAPKGVIDAPKGIIVDPRS